MGEWVGFILLIVLGGVGVTLAASAYAWWMAEPRRMGRTFRAGLEGPPDAALIAVGSGRGVALSTASARFVAAWDFGGWRLTFALAEVLGAELDLDGAVAARALRGEPRRLLDRQSGAEREVRLRFIFDDARHPDFELVLWPSAAARGGPARPREAIAEGNRWIARIETILRKSGGALVLARPAADAAVPDAPKPRATAAPAPPDLFDVSEEDADDDAPPWDEDETELAD